MWGGLTKPYNSINSSAPRPTVELKYRYVGFLLDAIYVKAVFTDELNRLKTVTEPEGKVTS